MKWPTLQARLDNPIKTYEQALKQLKEVYPDAKLPPLKIRKQFEKELNGEMAEWSNAQSWKD